LDISLAGDLDLETLDSTGQDVALDEVDSTVTVDIDLEYLTRQQFKLGTVGIKWGTLLSSSTGSLTGFGFGFNVS